MSKGVIEVYSQDFIDDTDHTLALRSLTTLIEWMLIRDKKRLGDKDVTEKLKEIDLVKSLLSDDE